MERRYVLDIATTAMHIWDGIACQGRHKVEEILVVWGRGCLELTRELSRWAIYSENMVNEAPRNTPDHRGYGVYDYEVSSEFGRWYGDYILKVGQPPSDAVAAAKLEILFDDFFNQEEF